MTGCELFFHWRRMKTGRGRLQSSFHYFERTSHYSSCRTSHSTVNKRQVCGISRGIVYLQPPLTLFVKDLFSLIYFNDVTYRYLISSLPNVHACIIQLWSFLKRLNVFSENRQTIACIGRNIRRHDNKRKSMSIFTRCEFSCGTSLARCRDLSDWTYNDNLMSHLLIISVSQIFVARYHYLVEVACWRLAGRSAPVGGR